MPRRADAPAPELAGADLYAYGRLSDRATLERAQLAGFELRDGDRGDGPQLVLVFRNEPAARCVMAQLLATPDPLAAEELQREIAVTIAQAGDAASVHVYSSPDVILERALRDCPTVAWQASPSVRFVSEPLTARARVAAERVRRFQARVREFGRYRIGAKHASGRIIDTPPFWTERLHVVPEAERLGPIASDAISAVPASISHAGDAGSTSIWDHSSMFRRACEDRSLRRMPEMDCVQQLVALLQPIVRQGFTVLDVGCASGHYFHSLRALGLDYYGIDSNRFAIETAKRNLPRAGLDAERLRLMPVEDLPDDEGYDFVVCFNTLMYVTDHGRVLRALSRAARRCLLIRDCFGAQTDLRWRRDVLLDDGYQDLHAYFNVYGRDEVTTVLRREGFHVEFHEDWRRRHRFGGRAEVVGGIELPYEILVATRRGLHT